MPRADVSVRISPALADRLDAQAKRRVCSRTYLVVTACERLLEELEDVSDVLDTEARG